jgi:hypothetical protein
MAQRHLTRFGASLGLSLAALFCLPQSATAQLTGSGLITVLTKQAVGAAVVRGVDLAYDPVHGIYLIVGAHGPAYGIYVNRVGAPVGSPFFIKQGPHTQFPRVAWSPHINGTGGFLVAWTEEGGGGTNTLHTRTIATQPLGGGLYTGQLLGSDNVISDATSYAWMESGPAMAYSPVSQRFLVAWKTYPSATVPIRVRARLVNTLGQGVSAIATLSAGFARDPGVAWNSVTNEFGVSFSGEDAAGTTGLTIFARVSAGDPTSFTRHTFNSLVGLSSITDISYNPNTNRFVLAWEQDLAGSPPQEARLAEIEANGTVLGSGLASTRLGSYDALAVAFNPISGTFGLVGVDNVNDNVLAMELNSRGFPTSALTLIANGAGAHYPRVAANTAAPEWNSAFSSGGSTYPNLGAAAFVTTSTNGGPAGSFSGGGGGGGGSGDGGGSTTCTSPKPGADWVCVDGNWLPPGSGGGDTGSGGSTCTSPQPGADWVCVDGNWLPPGSGGGGGGDASSCTTVKPGPDWVCVNGNWLPPGSGGGDTGSGGSTCTSPHPGADWVCVDGNWLPPGSGGGGTGGSDESSCTTVKPGPDWVCVNGNWLPPGSGGGDTGGGGSTCTSPQPGADWVCVDGNWLPPGSGGGGTGSDESTCTTVKPGPDWVCVNGNWLPPGSGGGGDESSCTTVKPGPDWTCVNGNWLPPGSDGPLARFGLSGDALAPFARPADVAAARGAAALPARAGPVA